MAGFRWSRFSLILAGVLMLVGLSEARAATAPSFASAGDVVGAAALHGTLRSADDVLSTATIGDDLAPSVHLRDALLGLDTNEYRITMMLCIDE